MTKDQLKDLRYLTFFPKKYKAPKMSQTRWREVTRAYGNEQKKIACSDYHWRIITYDDGRKELAYLRVLKGGILTGAFPAIYRGVIVPRMISYGTYARIKNIELAF